MAQRPGGLGPGERALLDSLDVVVGGDTGAMRLTGLEAEALPGVGVAGPARRRSTARASDGQGEGEPPVVELQVPWSNADRVLGRLAAEGVSVPGALLAGSAESRRRYLAQAQRLATRVADVDNDLHRFGGDGTFLSVKLTWSELLEFLDPRGLLGPERGGSASVDASQTGTPLAPLDLCEREQITTVLEQLDAALASLTNASLGMVADYCVARVLGRVRTELERGELNREAVLSVLADVDHVLASAARELAGLVPGSPEATAAAWATSITKAVLEGEAKELTPEDVVAKLRAGVDAEALRFLLGKLQSLVDQAGEAAHLGPRQKRDLQVPPALKGWVESRLIEFGVRPEDQARIASFVAKLDLHLPSGLAWAQLAVELEVQRLLAECFAEVGRSREDDPLRRRMDNAHHPVAKLGAHLLARLEEVEHYTAIELAAAGYSFASLFAPTLHDGIGTEVALKLAHWLSGPYAGIKTSAELRAVIGGLGLEFPYGHREARQQCGGNLGKGEALARHRLFTVPASSDPTHFQHWYLDYFPPGGEPIKIDFSFNQFFNIDVVPGAPWVGTSEEMRRVVRAHRDELGVGLNQSRSINLAGAPGRLLSFFDGSPRHLAYQGFKPELIQRMQRRLERFAKEADSR